MDRALTTRVSVAALLLLCGFALFQALTQRAAAQSSSCSGANGGFNLDTYEANNYLTTYGEAIRLAASGHGFIAPYTIATGETVDFSFPGLESGPAAARTAPNPNLTIPPSIYESIVWAESGWSNGARSVPYGGVGPVLVSFDCGYGLAQITTGMGQFGSNAYAPGIPSARQTLIGTDFLANLAEGARILAGKWNAAPQYRPIAGNGNPAKLEDWYYAIWSYNGFALKNHPLDPDLDPLRGGGSSVEGVYHCNDPQAPNYDPLSTGQPTFGRGDFTYTEVIYGCMRYPPFVPGSSTSSQTSGFQPGQAAAIVPGTCTNLRSSPSTSASIVECLAGGTIVTIQSGGPQTADGYTWWPVLAQDGKSGWVAGAFLTTPTATPTPGSATPTPGGSPTPTPTPTVPKPPNPPPPVSGTGRMWTPQTFSMPDLSVPAVAAAFQLSNFYSCANDSSTCAAMDFPTDIPTADPPITTHTDSTPPVSPSLLSSFIENPVFTYNGPTTMTLGIASSGASNTATGTVLNIGTGVSPFRIRSSADWVVIKHPGDPAGRSMVGGVAVGTDIQVVTNVTTGATQSGYQSVLQFSLDPAAMPPGVSTATVVIEPLLGGGSPVTITVNATNAAAGETSLGHHLIVPEVASDNP